MLLLGETDESMGKMQQECMMDEDTIGGMHTDVTLLQCKDTTGNKCPIQLHHHNQALDTHVYGTNKRRATAESRLRASLHSLATVLGCSLLRAMIVSAL